MADIQPMSSVNSQDNNGFVKSFGLLAWIKKNGATNVDTGQRLITKEDSPKKGTKFSVAVFTLSDGSERSIPMSEKLGDITANDIKKNIGSLQIGMFANGHELLCTSNELENKTSASLEDLL